MPPLSDAPFGVTAGDSLLDWSWAVRLHQTVARPTEFGKDLIFTYGPTAFLVIRTYTPESWPHVLIGRGALTLLYSAVILAHRDALGRSTAARLFALAAIALAMNGAMDLFMQTGPLLLMFLSRRPDSQFTRRSTLAIAVALGPLMWAKVSIWPMAIAGVACVCVAAAGRKRFPWEAPVFAASTIASWLLCGYRLDQLPAFVTGSIEIIRGYEAMAIVRRSTDLAAGMYALLGAAGFALVWRSTRDTRPLLRCTIVMSVAGTLLMLFKHDCATIYHLIQFSVSISSLAMIFTLFVDPRFSTARPVLVSLALVPSILVPTYFGRPGPLSEVTGKPAEYLRLVFEPSRHHRHFRAAMDRVRAIYPIDLGPNLTVDLLTHNVAALLANGLDYHGRPVMQSYTVYTPGLSRANAEFFAGSHAPDRVIVDLDTLDVRLPLSEDALAMRELLLRYVPERRLSWGGTVLMPRATPLRVVARPMRSTPGEDDWIELPPGPGIVWAETQRRRPLVAALLSAAYRAPVWTIELRLATGEIVSHQLVPRLIESGFILSPYVAPEADFRDVYSALDGLPLPGDVRAYRLRRVRGPAESLSLRPVGLTPEDRAFP